MVTVVAVTLPPTTTATANPFGVAPSPGAACIVMTAPSTDAVYPWVEVLLLISMATALAVALCDENQLIGADMRLTLLTVT